MNRLFYGDNLEVLRESIPTESVDLIYLDPPFNSNRSYNVLFQEKSGNEAQAQIEAFDDTWTWSQESEAQFNEIMNSNAPNSLKDALEAMRRLLDATDVLAYLVMMAARLREMHRVLTPTGSIYLHCDPTASHYLKIIMDAIFGPKCFRNEIIWHYKTFHGNTKTYWPKKHDTIFFYSKSSTQWQFTQLFGDDYEDTIDFHRWKAFLKNGNKIIGSNMPMQDSRFTRYYRRFVKQNNREPHPNEVVLEIRGQAIDTVWDMKAVDPKDRDRLGYPTQKPLPLLERIITASSKPGDVVLDPFCGCGTTIDAAQKLGRRWIGIDITTLAIDLIDARLRHTYGEQIRQTYEILGIPKDISGAQALFKRSPFEFERWCVMTLDGQPNEKQVGDRGVDGVIRFPVDGKGASDRILISVKGGATNPGHVRDLIGTVESQRAAMGVFVSMIEPTRGMLEAVNHSGTYKHPANGQSYPKVQIISVRELLEGKRPKMPPTLLPYFQAQRRYGDGQMTLDISG